MDDFEGDDDRSGLGAMASFIVRSLVWCRGRILLWLELLYGSDVLMSARLWFRIK